jgi:chromosomal replication initiator protein
MILIRDIQRAISARHHIGVSALKGRRGKIKVVRARHTAMYLARRLTSHSFTTIGKHFGHRDHTTVLHGYRKVQERIHRNPKTRAFVAAMIDHLTGSAPL